MRLPLIARLALALAPLTIATTAAAQDAALAQQVRPLLSDRCFTCHGFDGNARKADLRLDTLDGQRGIREHGRPPVAPGDPSASELIRRIESNDPEVMMPPPESGLALSEAERTLLRRWVEAGAPYAGHWAFEPPTLPEPPPVENARWPRNDIDRFVLARLEAAGLEGSQPADRETLLRRVTLDLTGLPPSLAEIDAFVADPRNDAYERVVDRLLASPHFGERMALVWLDAARYADTNGFHHDNERTGWPYRDWVIRAFNENLPYDRFLTEQLAGDLLEDATDAQRIATAFCRMHNINDEGGALDPEYKVEAVCDRIETVATALMGVTLGCARCHDHKYDPFTQDDYYGMFAVFGSVDERGVYPNNFEQARAYPARLLFRSDDLARRTAAAEAACATARDALARAAPAIDRERSEYERTLVERHAVDWIDATLVAVRAASGSELAVQADGSALVQGEPPAVDTHTFELETDASAIRLLRLDALTDPTHGGKVGLSSQGNAVVTAVRVEARSRRAPRHWEPVRWRWAWADHEQPNGDFDALNLIDGTGEGWALQGHRAPFTSRTLLLLADQAFGFEGGTAVRVEIDYRSRYAEHVLGRPRVTLARCGRAVTEAFPIVASDWWLAGPFAGQDFATAWRTRHGPEAVASIDRRAEFGDVGWQHRPDIRDGTSVALTGGSSAFYFARTLQVPTARKISLSLGSDDAIRVFLNGDIVLENEVMRGVAPDQERLDLDLPAGNSVLVVEVVNGSGPGGFYASTISNIADPVRHEPAALLPPTSRTAKLALAFAESWNRRRSRTWAELAVAVDAREQELAAIEAEAVPVLVMRELDEPVEAFVLERGNYASPDPNRPASRGPPRVLGGSATRGESFDRLAFARWLVADEHPLTARVHVNRLWQMLFGRGLVASTENLGQQADPPSHPRLLDWLARRFIADGWDQKQLLRMLVTSATYRQSARRRPDAVAEDPSGSLIAWFPRRRLPAELVRDLALSVSGRLVPEIGGPSVRPYQPGGLWREVSIGASSNTQVFERDAGEALWRRSLYTFWKRTSPNPQMTLFDAPTREFCVVHRGSTNTPLQALVLWNDEQFVEAARGLAERALDCSGEDSQRLRTAFRWCTGRPPSPRELTTLTRTLDSFRQRYIDDHAAARALLDVGEARTKSAHDPRELAAWTMIGNTLLNLDATIVRG